MLIKATKDGHNEYIAQSIDYLASFSKNDSESRLSARDKMLNMAHSDKGLIIPILATERQISQIDCQPQPKPSDPVRALIRTKSEQNLGELYASLRLQGF